jgi:cysteine desulfurase
MPRLAALRDRLEAGVKQAGAIVIGEGAPRLPAISAIALPGASKDGLLIQLDLAGFAVSAGSACSSGKLKGSRVLAAMGLAPGIAGGALRISLGPQTSEADIDAFLAAYCAIAARAQAA